MSVFLAYVILFLGILNAMCAAQRLRKWWDDPGLLNDLDAAVPVFVAVMCFADFARHAL